MASCWAWINPGRAACLAVCVDERSNVCSSVICAWYVSSLPSVVSINPWSLAISVLLSSKDDSSVFRLVSSVCRVCLSASVWAASMSPGSSAFLDV